MKNKILFFLIGILALAFGTGFTTMYNSNVGVPKIGSALVIGVDDYGTLKFNEANTSASMIHNMLVSDAFGFDSSLCTDCTKEKLERALDKIVQSDQKQVLLYFAGIAVNINNDIYLIPAPDSSNFQINQPEKVISKGVSLSAIFQKLVDKKVFVIFDTTPVNISQQPFAGFNFSNVNSKDKIIVYSEYPNLLKKDDTRFASAFINAWNFKQKSNKTLDSVLKTMSENSEGDTYNLWITGDYKMLGQFFLKSVTR